jgi:DNA repair exonuclease SbcCD nuclease subunit
MALRFIQIGDTHLGATLAGMPAEVAGALREAVREVLREAFLKAAATPVDVVLMPGDLFEQDGLEPQQQLRFVYELAAGIEPLPVAIIPGNHDAIFPQSPYLTEPAPANVHVFTAPDFTAIETQAGAIVGRGAQAGEGVNAVDWSKLPQPAPAPGLLLLHASVLHAEDGRRHEQMIAPVSQNALEQFGYSYIALGHYHSWREFRRQAALGQAPSGCVYAAYAGCPQGQGWDEPGAKGYLSGEIADTGVKLEFIAAARHTIFKRRLALPHEYANDALEQLERELLATALDLGAQDMLELVLSGRWPQTWRPELEQYVARAQRKAWVAKPVEYSRVQFTPPLIGPGESAVVDEFVSRCDQAIAQGGQDEEAWRLARYLGHRLLSGQGLPGEVA